MSDDLAADLRLPGLASLAQRVAAGPRATLLEEALGMLASATSARGAYAFDAQGKLRQQVSFLAEAHPAPETLRTALGHLASRCLGEEGAVLLPDIRRDRGGIEDVGEIAALGATGVVAVSAASRGTP